MDPLFAASDALDLMKVFAASPFIYALLGLMSVFAFAMWLYTLLTFRAKGLLPQELVAEVTSLLKQGQYEALSSLCHVKRQPLTAIVKAGLITRHLGPSVMVDAMRSEGKRATASLWQRLALLNDIAIVAPMLGLLGTVIGMFYAFYDVNRSIESINALFDGLGIAVGTTVMGLIVAIVCMIFATTLKFRLIQGMQGLEQEALKVSVLIKEPSKEQGGYGSHSPR